MTKEQAVNYLKSSGFSSEAVAKIILALTSKEEVLDAIKSECAANDDNCVSCPFNISDAWHEYCLFMGDIPHEGTIPEDWELNKIKWNSYYKESEG